MTVDYESIYRKDKQALGPQTRAFSQFFKHFDKRYARILDVGCGQGRDALPIARLGHQVVGVDISVAGIKDLTTEANREGLSVTGVVADIVSYRPDGEFDVVVVDRTLHMLPPTSRVAVLERLAGCVARDGYLLIADERSNLAAFEAVLEASPFTWMLVLKRNGYLFAKRAG